MNEKPSLAEVAWIAARASYPMPSLFYVDTYDEANERVKAQCEASAQAVRAAVLAELPERGVNAALLEGAEKPDDGLRYFRANLDERFIDDFDGVREEFRVAIALAKSQQPAPPASQPARLAEADENEELDHLRTLVCAYKGTLERLGAPVKDAAALSKWQPAQKPDAPPYFVTSERLPTEADGKYILTWIKGSRYWGSGTPSFVADSPDSFPFWMPQPPAPEPIKPAWEVVKKSFMNHFSHASAFTKAVAPRALEEALRAAKADPAILASLPPDAAQ